MSLPFTNVHTHVFNSACAPDRFLSIIPVNAVRRMPRFIKNVVDSKAGVKTISGIHKLLTLWRKDNKRRELEKYIAFLDIGTEASQQQVFERAYQAGREYDPAIRIVGLTLNMDFMDSVPSKNQISFDTQLEEVKDIKRYYPTAFFPFLGVDPRHKGGQELVDWARPYFETGVKHKSGKVYPYFSGIKLYPALGFFPFDARLEALYAYAEQNDLPVMTHCTRAGSQYIGAQIEGLIPDVPDMIMLPNNPAVASASQNIIDRIAVYRQKGWIKNSRIGDNDLACDLFGHPENYVVLLEKFPRLKICLAHMGGSNEITNSKNGELAKIREVDQVSWFDRIQQMMQQYPNMYTDISYTLSDFSDVKSEVFKAVSNFLQSVDRNGNKLSDRVLFGTDFFMTEQERKEAELYKITKTNLAALWDQIGRTNTQRYLMQPL